MSNRTNEVLQQAALVTGRSQRKAVAHLIEFYKLEDISSLCVQIRQKYHGGLIPPDDLARLKILKKVISELID